MARRVLQLLFTLDAGGMENGVVNLTNRLAERGTETIVVCIDHSGVMEERLVKGVRVIELLRRQGFDFRAARRLAKIVKDERIDIIHSHNLGPLLYGVLAKILCLMRPRLVHGEHGQLAGREAEKKRLLQRRYGFKLCDAVHTVSGGMVSDLEAHGISHSKMRAILNGVDCGVYHPPESKEQARLAIGLPESAEVIGNSGRFARYKRHDLLIETFELLAPERPNLYLMIVGDGGGFREKVLAQIEASPFRERIVHTGYVSKPADYYRAMDLLVMPSLYEGLANAMLEAMACGVPPLVHNACGAKEVIDSGVNGISEAFAGAESVAKQVTLLLEDRDELNRLSLAARKSAESDWSIESMISGYDQMFDEVLGRESV